METLRLQVAGVIEGPPGKSAYDYAVEGGYKGTEEEFAKKAAVEYSDPIVNSAEGELIVLNDSAERTIVDFWLLGDTQQTSTTGKNLFVFSNDFSNYNPLKSTPDDVTYTDKSITVVASKAYVNVSSPTFNLDPNTAYVLSAIVETTGNISKDCVVRIFKNLNVTDNLREICIARPTTNGKVVSVNFTTDEMIDTTEVMVVLDASLDTTIFPIKTVFRNIQIEKGTTATPYELYTGGKPSPSPEYPQEIVNAGKLNEETGKYEVQVKFTGKNLFDTERARIIENWESSTRMLGYKMLPVYVGKGNKISVSRKPGVEIDNGVYVCMSLTYNGGTNGWIYRPDMADGGTNTLSTTSTEDYIYVLCITTGLLRMVDVVKELQLEIAPKPTPYEPYKSQTLTLTSDRPITKWDKLVEQDGQIGWLYGSKIIKLTGEEHWVWYPDFESFYTCIDDLKRDTVLPLANKYIYKSIITTDQDKIFSAHDGSEDKLWIRDTRFSTSLVDFKSYLQDGYSNGISVEVVYSTKDIEFVPLPQDQQDTIRALKTYYPTTVITADGGELHLTTQIDYIADTKNYINSKFTTLNASLVNTQAQLLQEKENV